MAAAARRIKAARELAAGGCDVVVLDDGFQHRRLARDLDGVLIAAETWTRAPRLLPRGPWREPPRSLGRAGAVVVTRKSASAERARVVAEEAAAIAAPGTPVAICHLAAETVVPLHGGAPASPAAFRGRRLLAVAALATPRPFFDALRGFGAEVEEAAYPDHHPFSAEEARRIAARAAGRPILITHKDAVKLRPLLPSSEDVLVLAQSVRIEAGGDALDAAIGRALQEPRG